MAKVYVYNGTEFVDVCSQTVQFEFDSQFYPIKNGDEIWDGTQFLTIDCPINITYEWTEEFYCEQFGETNPEFAQNFYYGTLLDVSDIQEADILTLEFRNYLFKPTSQVNVDITTLVPGRTIVFAIPNSWGNITDLRDDSGNDNILPDLEYVKNVSVGGADMKVFRYTHNIGIISDFKIYITF